MLNTFETRDDPIIALYRFWRNVVKHKFHQFTTFPFFKSPISDWKMRISSINFSQKITGNTKTRKIVKELIVAMDNKKTLIMKEEKKPTRSIAKTVNFY